MMTFSDLEHRLQSSAVPLSVCMPEEDETMAALAEASRRGYVRCLCVGDLQAMKASLARLDDASFTPELIAANGPEEAAATAVALVRNGTAKALMKGTVPTPTLLKAVLHSETGIKKSPVLSHALVYEWDGAFRILTDGGMVPHPTLEEKQEILTNAVWLAQRLGTPCPRVAVLAAVEKVSPKMAATVDAAVLAKMGDRHQLGTCLVDGPLALDNAISLESAHHKGLDNEVVGRADILVAPDIDTGNVLGKTILYFTKARAGGLIIGAQVPIILLSRADDKETRLNSITLALGTGLPS
jgi:phosphate butyryltransferase